MTNFFKTVCFIGVLVFSLGSLVGAEPLYPPLEDTEEWSGSYFKRNKLGFTQARVDVEPEQIKVRTVNYMRLQLAGKEQITSFTQDSVLSPDLKVKGFSLVQEVTGNRQKVDGTVKNGKLELTIASAGFTRKKSIDFDPDMALGATYLLNILHSGLEVGKKGELNVFLEPFQLVSTLNYAILRRETMESEQEGTVNAFVIKQNLSGIQSTLWLAPDGTVLREISPQGFESRQEPSQVARSMPDGVLSVSNFITLSRVKVDREIESPRKIGELKLRLSKLNANETLPEDQRQKVVEVTKEDEEHYSALVHVRVEPKKPGRILPRPISGFQPAGFLKDNSEVQSNHPQIRALARVLVGEERDSWRAARMINAWVYNNLEKELVDAFTAVDALRQRKGECESHTNLFTAIARSAGIPTRIVNGLIYSKEFDGFVYHAWPEVYVGEWRALDPTLGQMQVDATHVKLSAGERGSQIKLLQYIGQVGIEVID